MEPTDGRAFANRGIANLGMGNLESALTDYDKSIKFNPYHPLGYVNRAILNSLLGSHTEVLKDIDKAEEFGYDRDLLLSQIEEAKIR